MKRARIDLRVREDQKATWEVEAEARGLDLSELIRRAVEQFIELNQPVTN